MSWIEKERKRRLRAADKHAAAQAAADSGLHVDGEHAMRALWQRCGAGPMRERDVRAVLRQLGGRAFDAELDFLTWLRAPNGAALGFTGDAVRFLWPERKASASNNFWIRWNEARAWLEVSQRVSQATPPVMKDRRFDERRIELILRGLVRGERVKAASLRKKRFGLF